ncbi:hypothetical protein B0H10DRAFT_1948132 [Mycena sp. CBHHK59/15]|nr:hypothetical protein B0H10DRAFT_1948132 [Mycena sp. CBHHK59/15]
MEAPGGIQKNHQGAGQERGEDNTVWSWAQPSDLVTLLMQTQTTNTNLTNTRPFPRCCFAQVVVELWQNGSSDLEAILRPTTGPSPLGTTQGSEFYRRWDAMLACSYQPSTCAKCIPQRPRQYLGYCSLAGGQSGPTNWN